MTGLLGSIITQFDALVLTYHGLSHPNLGVNGLYYPFPHYSPIPRPLFALNSLVVHKSAVSQFRVLGQQGHHP